MVSTCRFEGNRDPRVMEDEPLVTIQTITDIPEDETPTYFVVEDESKLRRTLSLLLLLLLK